jgi:hypothetical protein
MKVTLMTFASLTGAFEEESCIYSLAIATARFIPIETDHSDEEKTVMLVIGNFKFTPQGL